MRPRVALAQNMRFGSRCGRLACVVLAVLLGTPAGASAEEFSREFWPEVDTWLRLSPAWRLSLFVPISANVDTEYREGNVILQADYFWGKIPDLFHARLVDEDRAGDMKAMMARGGVLGGKSLDDEGASYSEQTLFMELHVRTPLDRRILLSNRLRTDLRWLGDDADFSTRLRYRLMVEKEFETRLGSLVPYVNVEPYYDSRYGIVNRVRTIGGTSLSWSKRYALEGNVTYQYDSKSSVTNLLALNLILHLFL